MLVFYEYQLRQSTTVVKTDARFVFSRWCLLWPIGRAALVKVGSYEKPILQPRQQVPPLYHDGPVNTALR